MPTLSHCPGCREPDRSCCSLSGGRTITVAGERFHMVQNVSMAVHHIGREPTVRGPGKGGGGALEVRWSCVARVLKFLPVCSTCLLHLSLAFTLSLHFSTPVALSYPVLAVLQGSQLHAHHLPVSWSPEQCFSACRLLHQWPGICRRGGRGAAGPCRGTAGQPVPPRLPPQPTVLHSQEGEVDQTSPRRAAHPCHPCEHLTGRASSGRREQLTWEPHPHPSIPSTPTEGARQPGAGEPRVPNQDWPGVLRHPDHLRQSHPLLSQ